MAFPPICGPGPQTASERSFNTYLKYGHNIPPPLGPLIRLHPQILPSHLLLQQPTISNRLIISSHATSLLLEAQTFITKIVPRVFAIDPKAKTSTPSLASVELSSHKVSQAEVPYESRPLGATGVAETWAARVSEHVNAGDPGTASWEEFECGVGDGEFPREKAESSSGHVVFD